MQQLPRRLFTVLLCVSFNLANGQAVLRPDKIKHPEQYGLMSAFDGLSSSRLQFNKMINEIRPQYPRLIKQMSFNEVLRSKLKFQANGSIDAYYDNNKVGTVTEIHRADGWLVWNGKVIRLRDWTGDKVSLWNGFSLVPFAEAQDGSNGAGDLGVLLATVAAALALSRGIGRDTPTVEQREAQEKLAEDFRRLQKQVDEENAAAKSAQ